MRQVIALIAGITICLNTGCKKDVDYHAEPGTPNYRVTVSEKASAFPGAEGFGKDVTGGRGGRVIKVTNLNDDGPGSLRAAVMAGGPRMVLFEVSGTITLESELRIHADSITIAGQTAPGDGICLKKKPFVIGADNVIIRYLRFRMGDEAQKEADAISATEHKNIIIDHCSISWGTDECASFYSNENFTMQWCIISEGLRNSIYGKGTHGFGGMWGGKNASFHHNLIAHQDTRGARLGEVVNSSFALTDLVDVRNNVIYNWGAASMHGGEGMNVNLVNNYYKPGPATPVSKSSSILSIDKNLVASAGNYNVWGKFFIEGNVVEGGDSATANNWTYGVYTQYLPKYSVTDAEKAGMRQGSAFSISNNVTTHNAATAYLRVLDYAGASLKKDAIDSRIVDDVKNGKYTAPGSNGSDNGHIDTQSDVGGWTTLSSGTPPTDTDGDGMPDEWEVSKGIDPNKANPAAKELSTGYDNIEVYINSLVKTITDEQVKS